MPVDEPRIERAVRELLEAIGEDPDRDGLQRTPARVAAMFAEVVRGYDQDPETLLNVTFDACHDEMIMVRDIPLYSLCEHHMVPFSGRAHVAYIPNEDGRITGLSKLARLVDVYARRLQVQEKLTSEIADSLERVLQPRCARRDRGRTPLHGDARRPEVGYDDDHERRARPVPRRRPYPG